MLGFMALLMLTQQFVEPMAEGTASYYTVASSSNLTASGERMRDDALTCAMREGEFGSYLLVVAENGRSVICRLNDRGPYVAGRVIDLSEAAMERLIDPSDGLVDVSVYNLGKLDDESIRLAQLN
jgi:peptidoglycan lytic transglycosylase